jgi:hypothetical protein
MAAGAYRPTADGIAALGSAFGAKVDARDLNPYARKPKPRTFTPEEWEAVRAIQHAAAERAIRRMLGRPD